MEDTHHLDRRGQASLAGVKCDSHGTHSLPGEPMTSALSRVQIQPTTEATHQLDSRREAFSARSKCTLVRRQLTNWTAGERCRQQGSHATHIVGTYLLKSRG